MISEKNLYQGSACASRSHHSADLTISVCRVTVVFVSYIINTTRKKIILNLTNILKWNMVNMVTSQTQRPKFSPHMCKCVLLNSEECRKWLKALRFLSFPALLMIISQYIQYYRSYILRRASAAKRFLFDVLFYMFSYILLKVNKNAPLT